MVALTSISLLLLHSLPNNKLLHYHSNIKYTKPISSSFSYGQRSTDKASRSKLYTSISSVSTNLTDPFEAELESSQTPDGKFDWYSNWCPIMPVCDLDKRRPHGKKVMGIDVVVWWDKNESEWKVFDDSCPHRLAPLSEGRIDQWGRLQCVYHGWCFNGSGNCNFIPQAPPDGPPVQTSKKACVSVYPSTVQNGIVWFWPNTDPKYKNIITKQKPPYIAEMDDPSFSQSILNREFDYGYEVMVENLMDPAHVPYAHHGLMRTRLPDAYLLHLEERKIMEAGVGKWNKACFVPTKSDVHVVAFRKWLNKYGGGQVDWGGKFSGALPPTPPREQLMDRYWSHVVNCSSCSAAHKGLKVLEVMLQVMSIALIGYVGVTNKQSQSLKIGMVSMALLCFVASKWLSHFIHKIFYFHDYDHAFR
ncbi:hypothetical protein CsatA_005499 [Cannabis sativa]